jgi:hypothetical protein
LYICAIFIRFNTIVGTALAIGQSRQTWYHIHTTSSIYTNFIHETISWFMSCYISFFALYIHETNFIFFFLTKFSSFSLLLQGVHKLNYHYPHDLVWSIAACRFNKIHFGFFWIRWLGKLNKMQHFN